MGGSQTSTMNPTARFAVFAFALAVFHGQLFFLFLPGGDGVGEGVVDGVGVCLQLVGCKAFAEALQGGELLLCERCGTYRKASYADNVAL